MRIGSNAKVSDSFHGYGYAHLLGARQRTRTVSVFDFRIRNSDLEFRVLAQAFRCFY